MLHKNTFMASLCHQKQIKILFKCSGKVPDVFATLSITVNFHEHPKYKI